MQLDLQHIEKHFGPKHVLRDVCFTARSGAAFGLLGRNGAGKTTTLRILMNVFPADSGALTLDGRPLEPGAVRFGYLPEERGLYPKKKILDQLCYFAQLHGLSRREAVESTDRWLDRLGMAEYRNKRLDTLSKGNQQKIQLITALAHDPDIVILDEPFSGLDPVNAQLLKDVVMEEIHRGKLVLFSSHQMNYIEEFCTAIAILNGGRVVLAGDLKDIKRSYPRTRLVLRSPQAQALLAAYPDRCAPAGDDRVFFTLREPGEKQAVMAELSTRFDLDQLQVFEPSLNDIFVEYAQEQEADQ